MGVIVTLVLLVFCFSTVRGQSQAATPNCDNADAKVLILGAGMTGISAAWTLHKEGECDFIILEAQDRIGGRMRTGSFSGLSVNFGATWIQGVSESMPELHPLWEWVEKCNVEGFFDNVNFPPRIHSADGQDITDSLGPRFEAWSEAIDAATMASEIGRSSGEPDASVRMGLTEGGWTPQTPGDNLIEWLSFDACHSQTPDITSLYVLPVATFIDFGDPGTSNGYFINDTRGFHGVLQCIADEFLAPNDQRLHLEAPVTNIQWSDSEECVCVTVTEGGEERKYCAPNAIVTFSLGVLQSQEFQDIVTPPLPQWKLDAINALSFATHLVVFADFSTRFWDNKTDVPYILRASDERGEFVLWQNYQKFYNGKSNVLTFRFTGDVAERIINQPKNETMNEMFTVLQEFYGNVTEMPLDIAIGDWSTNPYFLGMFSNIPVGTTLETHAILAAPVGGLYFSGEATSTNYTGFVHGSYLEGISVANAILNSAVETEVSGIVFIAAVVISMVTYLV